MCRPARLQRCTQRWTGLDIGSYVSKVKSQEDEQPSLHIMARSTVYNVNETKAIFCRGQNLVDPIQWYSPSGDVIEERSNKNNRIYVEDKIEKNFVLKILIIHRINISDGGTWICKSGNLSESKEFIVGEKVNILNKHVELQGEEHKSIKMTCEAEGYPPPVVVWYKEKQVIKEKDNEKKYHVRADHTLEIKKLNHADAGLYTCKVKQKALSHYTEKTVQLSVLHKPIIYNKIAQTIYAPEVYKSEEVYAILNDTKNVTCSALGNPPPTYKWFRRLDSYDDPILDPDTVISAEDGTSSVLVLRMYNASYFGEYKCSVSNSKGTESIVFHVSAGSKPEPPDYVTLVSANVTDLIFSINCSSCTFQTEDSMSPNPSNILGFSFQFAIAKNGYDPDWTDAMEFEVDASSDDTLYDIGPLPNSTTFHAQVRTRNAAGYSDWLDIPGPIATTDYASKLSATVSIIFLAVLLALYQK